MTVLQRLGSLLRAVLGRRRLEREMALEWQFHLDARVDALVREGLPRDAAARQARREFGDPLRWREQGREARGLGPLQDLGADIRDAFRQIRRAPVFASVVVATVALGIGANTAIFSVVNGLLLRPLPLEEPNRLVMLSVASASAQATSRAFGWPYSVFEHVRDAGAFDSAIAWSDFGTTRRRLDLGRSGAVDPVDGAFVSDGYFDALGVRALVGRTFTEADVEREAGTLPAVISYGFWQRRFGGDPGIVGTELSVDRVPVTIIGVLPPGFFGLEVGRSFDVLLPLASAPVILRDPEWLTGSHATVSVLLRLRPEQSVEQATALLRGMQVRMADAVLPPSCVDCRQTFLADPFMAVPVGMGISELRGQYREPLLTVLIIAVLVLLVACVNVANLMTARVAARGPELGIRLALGSPRWRLARQMLVEALVLGIAGASAGLVLAQWASAALVGQLATLDTRVVLQLPLDGRVLSFTIGAMLVTVVLFGAGPAIRASRAAPAHPAMSPAAGATTGRRPRLGEGALLAQVALSLVLVAAATVFVRSFERLLARPVGFDAERVLLVTVDTAHTNVETAGRYGLYQRLIDAVRAVPGVEGAALSAVTPVSATSVMAHFVGESMQGPPSGERMERIVASNYVTPGWFGVYGTPLLKGRDFEPRDNASAERVVAVNQAFVERFLPDREPLGERVSFATTPAGPRRIVAVVADAILMTPAESSVPTVYEPLAQWNPDEGLPSRLHLSIRAAAGAPTALVPGVASAIAAVDADLSYSVRSLAGQVEAALARNRLLAWLSSFFGLLGLLLAAIGLYGLTAYAAAERRREMGIRMALGSARHRVVTMMLWRVLRLVIPGLTAGIVASAWLSRFVTGLVYGIDPADARTLATAAVLLTAVGALAAWLPAWRVSRADPWAVLREP